MLSGRYTKDTGEFEIQGDFPGLLNLAKVLTEVYKVKMINLIRINPAPYDACIKNIKIKKANQENLPVEIKKEGDNLSIYGSAKNLKILAENVKYLIEQSMDRQSSIQNHIHIEYYSDHPYLSSNSVSLVVSFRDKFGE